MRTCHRCRTGRGLSDPLRSRSFAPASLGPRRLAAHSLYHRCEARCYRTWPLEDARQPAPVAHSDRMVLRLRAWLVLHGPAWRADLADFADLLAVRRSDDLASDQSSAAFERQRCQGAFLFRLVRRPLDQCSGGAPDRLHCRFCLHHDGRDRPFALSPVRFPQVDAGMEDGRFDPVECAGQPDRLLPVDVACAGNCRAQHHSCRHPGRQCLPRRHSVCDPVDLLAARCLVCQPVGRDGRQAVRAGKRVGRAAQDRAPHLALFRNVRDAGTQLSAAGQLSGKAEPVGRQAHLADQYRRLSPVDHFCASFRLDQLRRDDRTA
ncbi:hypothetical protein D3C80_693760 [compost metagenome]